MGSTCLHPPVGQPRRTYPHVPHVEHVEDDLGHRLPFPRVSLRLPPFPRGQLQAQLPLLRRDEQGAVVQVRCLSRTLLPFARHELPQDVKGRARVGEGHGLPVHTHSADGHLPRVELVVDGALLLRLSIRRQRGQHDPERGLPLHALRVQVNLEREALCVVMCVCVPRCACRM